MKVLKLGTRKSLLAWAQSSWVAREVEKANPDIRVELVGIETQGDRIQNIPLHQIDGKEFFVKEIDEALLTGNVDFTVHSLKDLSLERPQGLQLAAIPKRENPRDVILFGPHVLEKIKKQEPIKIGSSSPRRKENIPDFLKKALPYLEGNSPILEWVEIRGNVNSRLARLQETKGSSKYLDGVVLAFAGLIRLWNDGAGRAELSKLLKNSRWMVLPLNLCPAAPAQGALAIECRKEDFEVLNCLKKINHLRTNHHIAKERQILQQWGGGCHQRFGATSVDAAELEDLFYIRGAKPSGEFVEELRWNFPQELVRKPKSWNGFSVRSSETKTLELFDMDFESGAGVFIAHARALPSKWADRLFNSRVWTSGTSSWFQLAHAGVWVEGCAEGLGFEELTKTLWEPVLQLPEPKNWIVLTHKSAIKGWKIGTVIPTYEIHGVGNEFKEADLRNLKTATHIFWASGSQFEACRDFFHPDAHHSCGPGKTAQTLREAGIKNLSIFPNVAEWEKWVGK